jgi:hypothetical protein
MWPMHKICGRYCNTNTVVVMGVKTGPIESANIFNGILFVNEIYPIAN